MTGGLGANPEWTVSVEGAGEVNQVSLAGSWSRRVLDANEQMDSSNRERKSFAAFKQKRNNTARFCLER